MDTFLVLLGYIGVGFLLIGYFLLVMGHLKVTDTPHVMLNVLGSLLVVIAIYSGIVLPIMYVIGIWLLISLVGLFKHHTTTTA